MGITAQVGWAKAERLDPRTQEVQEFHVVPIKLVPVFATFEEGQAFVKRLEAENNPCVSGVDEHGEKQLYTHFGHILSDGCHCKPTLECSEIPTYVHGHVC